MSDKSTARDQFQIQVHDVSAREFKLITVNYPSGNLWESDGTIWYSVDIAATNHTITCFRAEELEEK